MNSALGNAIRATVLVNGRNELHLKFNNDDELRRAYAELDGLANKYEYYRYWTDPSGVKRNERIYPERDGWPKGTMPV